MVEKINSSPIPEVKTPNVPRKPSKDEQSASFANELAGAQAMAQAMAAVAPAPAPQQAQAPAPQAGTQAAEGAKNLVAKDLGQALIQGTQAQPQMAERAPLTQAKAIGLNTAMEVAGLQPWSKNWVFPEKGVSPELKPLIAESGDGANPLLAALAGSEAKPADGRLAQAVQQLLRGEARGENITAGVLAGEKPAHGAAAANAQSMHPNESAGTQALQAQLSALNGEVISQSSHGNEDAGLNGLNAMMTMTEDGQAAAGKPAQARPGVSALSGGEYLSTMQALRAGQDASSRSGAGGQPGQDRGGSRPALSVIPGGKQAGVKKPGQGGEAFPAMAASPLIAGAQPSQASPSPAVEVTGHVVKGRMSQDRLSSESLLGVSAGIKNISSLQNGGGEMRVRLKPDHLGELHVKVVASGNRIGLQIQASDESAKKVIEESIGHLRENLAVQNLNLASIDVSVAQTATSSRDAGQQQQQQQQGQAQQFQDLMGQNSGHGQNGRAGHESTGRDDGFAPVRTAPRSVPHASAGASTRSSAASAAGRLDVQA